MILVGAGETGAGEAEAGAGEAGEGAGAKLGEAELPVMVAVEPGDDRGSAGGGNLIGGDDPLMVGVGRAIAVVDPCEEGGGGDRSGDGAALAERGGGGS